MTFTQYSNLAGTMNSHTLRNVFVKLVCLDFNYLYACKTCRIYL